MPRISIPHPWEIPEALATPESAYLNRRQLLATLGLGALGFGLGQAACGSQETPGEIPPELVRPAIGDRFQDRFPAPRNPAYTLGDRPLTPEAVAGRYNNFYEFTTTKDQVWRLAAGYPVDPWKVQVTGLVKRPRTLDLTDLFTRFPLEERLYRFRCVEAWAAQIPWTGFPLRKLIDDLEPLGSARYVRFVSFLDPERLPGQRHATHYPWPYYEALRLDEARHELAMVVVGSYGHPLPMQHGAPWRVVVPWKYGFKSPKSIVRIEFTRKQPPTFWNDVTPHEYGFFSNVNPKKPHPRWSQARERDIGTGESRPTLPYNGYAQEVASLYTGAEY